MTTQQNLIAKYGNPLEGKVQQEMFERSFMEVLKYPSEIAHEIPCLGSSIYINKNFSEKYIAFLRELIKRGLHTEIKENDQCFLPRYQRGSTTVISIHTWGEAVDLNPTQNPIFATREQCVAMGLTPFTKEFTQCVRDCGLITGEDFPGRPDLMHIENTKNL